MQYSKCWCGSELYEKYASFRIKPLRKDSVRIKIVRCNRCGTVRMFDNGLNEIPDYQESYSYLKVSERHLRTISLIEKYHSGTSVLDIGCNTGMLLNEIGERVKGLKKLKGIDLDANAIKIGRQRYGLDLEAIDAKSLDEKFDNIVLCHTLEHIPDLKDFSNTLDRLLNPGGKVFIAVPNIESVGAGYFLRFWPALSPQYHLWYFDGLSLSAFFKSTLPEYEQLFISSFFIWKPLIFPSFYWKKINSNKSALQRLENKMKGDQLDLVVSKPVG